MSKKSLKGVNLGGWLVLEKWMTPSLFLGTSALNERQLSKTENGRQKILKHRRSFMTETDFLWLKKHQIDAVRIPVGYWIFGDVDGYVGSISVLDWAFDMCEEYDLKVLLDLHAIPGAQNNQDHSGDGNTSSEKRFLKQNLAKTTEILEKLIDRYGSRECFWGIELMNEPKASWPPHRIKLKRWTKATAKKLRRKMSASQKIIFSDAYDLLNWGQFLKAETIDVHYYQTFSWLDRRRKTHAKHLGLLGKKMARIKQKTAGRKFMIGEYSGVLDQKVNQSGQEIKEYILSQQAQFSGAEAMFYWSYKTESNDAWNYRYLVESGILKE